MAKVRVKCKGGTKTFKSKAAKSRYEAYKHMHTAAGGKRKRKKK